MEPRSLQPRNRPLFDGVLRTPPIENLGNVPEFSLEGNPFIELFDYNMANGDSGNHLLEFKDRVIQDPLQADTTTNRLLNFTLFQNSDNTRIVTLLDYVGDIISKDPITETGELSAVGHQALKLIKGVEAYLAKGSFKTYTIISESDEATSFRLAQYANHRILKALSHIEGPAIGKPVPYTQGLLAQLHNLITRPHVFPPFTVTVPGHPDDLTAIYESAHARTKVIFSYIKALQEQEKGQPTTCALPMLQQLSENRDTPEVKSILNQRFGTVRLIELLQEQDDEAFSRKAMMILANLPPGNAFFGTLFEGLFFDGNQGYIDIKGKIEIMKGNKGDLDKIKFDRVNPLRLLHNLAGFQVEMVHQLLMPYLDPSQKNDRFERLLNQAIPVLTEHNCVLIGQMITENFADVPMIMKALSPHISTEEIAERYPLLRYITGIDHIDQVENQQMYHAFCSDFISREFPGLINNIKTRFAPKKKVDYLCTKLEYMHTFLAERKGSVPLFKQSIGQLPQNTVQEWQQKTDEIRRKADLSYVDVINSMAGDVYIGSFSKEDDPEHYTAGFRTVALSTRTDKKGVYFGLHFENEQMKNAPNSMGIIHGYTDENGNVRILVDDFGENEYKTAFDYLLLSALEKLSESKNNPSDQNDDQKTAETKEAEEERVATEYLKRFVKDN